MNSNGAKEMSEELRLLYSSCVTELIGFKSQQWHTTNYGILLFAAVISISELIKPTRCFEWVALYTASIIIFGTGWYIISTLFGSIFERRVRLSEIRKKASDDFMICWSGGTPRPQIVDNPNEKIKLGWFFYGVFVLGFSVTMWLLIRAHICAS